MEQLGPPLLGRRHQGLTSMRIGRLLKQPKALFPGAASVLVIAVVIGLLAGRSHKPYQVPVKPAEEGLRPLVSMSLNGTRYAEVFRGWPLIVEAGLFYPSDIPAEAEKKPIVIATKDGVWSNAVRIDVHKTPAQGQSWPLHLAPTPSPTLSLDPQAEGDLVWWISPDDSAQLSEGDYELVAVLDTTGSAASGAWKGTTRSVPVSVRLRNEPQPLSEEQESEKYHLLESYYFLRGDSKQATATMEELLQRQPDNLGALEFKGDALAEEGKTTEALAYYRRALSALLKKYPTTEPPRELLVKQHRLLDTLLHAGKGEQSGKTDTR